MDTFPATQHFTKRKNSCSNKFCGVSIPIDKNTEDFMAMHKKDGKKEMPKSKGLSHIKEMMEKKKHEMPKKKK